MIDILLLVLCGMSSSALAKESSGKYSTPLLDVKVQQLILEANQTLQLKCRGKGALLWIPPLQVATNNQSVQVSHSRCRRQHCSTLTISAARAWHTGSYRCAYSHRQNRHTGVYIYVTDSRHPFVKDHSVIPELVFLVAGKPLLFPCQVTSPDAAVVLVKVQPPRQSLVPDQKEILWNSKEGFTIRTPTILHTGLFYCQTTVAGVTHQQFYLVHRPVYTIDKVVLNASRPVQALLGDRLVLNCTATAPLNTRVNIRWSYPGEGLRKISQVNRMEIKGLQVVFHSILTVSHLRKYDRGMYVCHMRNDRAHGSANTTVTIYDQPFIRLKHRNGSEVQAFKGQKSFRLAPKVRAFPTPEIIWLKDGVAASEKCSRYHMDGTSLLIRDVAEEDAGVYTVLAGIQKFGLYQNLTISLVVNARPQMGEKAVLVQDPGTVRRGSRHAVRCTSHGVPPPQVQWLWHPCPPKGRCIPPPAPPPRSARRVTSPRAGVSSPRAGVSSPRAGVSSPRAGVSSPRAGVSSPRAGVSSPRAAAWEWRPVTEQVGVSSPGNPIVHPGNPIVHPGNPILSIPSPGNPILSITQRQEELQGRNKTVGVLTVSEAWVSGVYRCVASSLAGEDHMDIPFIVTDDAAGFRVRMWEEPTEGRELRLSCVVTRHLYSGLTWQRVTDGSEAAASQPTAGPAPALPLLGGEETQDEGDMRTLTLLLSNLTMGHSGVYRCSARNLLTGELVHEDTRVEVTALEAPSLLHHLTDCRVNISTSVTLECPATGVPNPRVTWYKDHIRLRQVSGVMMAPEGGASLHIERITVEDQGLYTCQASNGRGSVESSAYVWVEGSAEERALEIVTLVCTCVVSMALWMLLTILIRKLRQPRPPAAKAEYLSIMLDPGEELTSPGEGPMSQQCDRLHFDPAHWEFPRGCLKFERPLGQGAYGRVMQASAFGIGTAYGSTTVAVKMLKEGATPSEHKALMSELKILNYIGHHLNVVNLLGACTLPGGPLLVIVEYCQHGNLSAFLKSQRDAFLISSRVTGEGSYGKRSPVSLSSSQNNSSSSMSDEESEGEEDEGQVLVEDPTSSPLFFEDLVSYSFQVARGMEFLASRKCIHRDLAARNVLLSANNVVKICDFGLARDIYKNPDYVRRGDARLPLKWMAPESIFDKVFTTQSDVWSFGILLWEIFSLGGSPYPGMSMGEEFCHRLKNGSRMSAPEYSTPEIYNIMLSCWESEASERPTFTHLLNTLGNLLQACAQQDGKHYIPLDSLLSGDISVSLQNDYRDVRRHRTPSHGYINTRGMDAVRTEEETPQGKNSQDNPTYNSMAVPAEERKHIKWIEKLQPGNLSKLFSIRGSSVLVGCVEALPCVSSSEDDNSRSSSQRHIVPTQRHIVPCQTH